MKISNNPPQHLSNYEVLQHFFELKADNDVLVEHIANHDARAILKARAQFPLNKYEAAEAAVVSAPDLSEEELRDEDAAARRGVSKDLVWATGKVLEYLCADFNVTARQTAEGIESMTDKLQDYGLMKAELLQIVNLAPTSEVGLYLIIEEAESRLTPPYADTMNEIISTVIAPTILDEVPEELHPFVSSVRHSDIAQGIMADAAYAQDDEYAEDMGEEFVYEAEWGAGHEAAIDDEEDNTMD